MSFTVVLSIFMVLCTTINGCPSHRPCKTANETNGNCIRARNCPSIYRFNRVKNLTIAELEFLNKSICGIDLDKSKLVCCDNNEISAPEQIVSLDESENSFRTSAAEETIQGQQLYTSPIAPEIISTTVKPPEPVVYCRTPNGEKAQCLSIYECPNLLRALVNSTDSQKRFLKESGCGFDSQKVAMVCCGSDTNFPTNNDGQKRNFRQNPYIPIGACGIENLTFPNRIFGGTNSDLGEFPWTALLAYETLDGKKMFACGGSLISSRYVLTAAHCVSEQNAFANISGIRLGEWDYSNKGPDCVTVDGRTVCNEEVLNIGIESIHRYPEYRLLSKEKYHDIALIRLNKEVRFTNNIRPICLPNIDDNVTPGDRLTISGWGLVNYDQETTIKQKVEVPVVSRSQCSVMFEKSPRLTEVGLGQFCAGGEPGKDACVGDSGAPLMKKRKSNASDADLWFVEGIVSFGSGCGLVNQYGVYTKVSQYVPWIHSTVVL